MAEVDRPELPFANVIERCGPQIGIADKVGRSGGVYDEPGRPIGVELREPILNLRRHYGLRRAPFEVASAPRIAFEHCKPVAPAAGCAISLESQRLLDHGGGFFRRSRRKPADGNRRKQLFVRQPIPMIGRRSLHPAFRSDERRHDDLFTINLLRFRLFRVIGRRRCNADEQNERALFAILRNRSISVRSAMGSGIPSASFVKSAELMIVTAIPSWRRRSRSGAMAERNSGAVATIHVGESAAVAQLLVAESQRQIAAKTVCFM